MIALIFAGIALLFVLTIIGIAFFLAFALRYIDFNTNAPDFLNVDNVFGWLAIILAFIIVAALIGFAMKVLLGLINLPARLMIAGSFNGTEDNTSLRYAGFAWVGVVFMATLVLIGYVTYLFMSYAVANPELSEFYAGGSWFAYILAFLVFATILLPSSKDSSDA